MPFFPFKYAKELDSMANAEKTGTGRFKTLPNTTKLFRGKSSFGLQLHPLPTLYNLIKEEKYDR